MLLQDIYLVSRVQVTVFELITMVGKLIYGVILVNYMIIIPLEIGVDISITNVIIVS